MRRSKWKSEWDREVRWLQGIGALACLVTAVVVQAQSADGRRLNLSVPKADMARLLAPPSTPTTESGRSGITRLPGVTVEGKLDAFSDSEARLRKLKNALPCFDSCEIQKPGRHSLTNIALNMLTPQAPRQPSSDPEDRAARASTEGIASSDNVFGAVPTNLRP